MQLGSHIQVAAKFLTAFQNCRSCALLANKKFLADLSSEVDMIMWSFIETSYHTLISLLCFFHAASLFVTFSCGNIMSCDLAYCNIALMGYGLTDKQTSTLKMISFMWLWEGLNERNSWRQAGKPKGWSPHSCKIRLTCRSFLPAAKKTVKPVLTYCFRTVYCFTVLTI